MGLIGLIAFVLVIYQMTQLSSLRTEVEALKKSRALSPQTAPETSQTHSAQAATSTVPQQQPAIQPPQDSAFVKWLKEDWLVKLGALLLFLGIGWFIPVVAFQVIGPVGRILLGLLFGVSMLVLGVWRIKTRIHQGAIFAALGSTIILLVMFAARTAYDMFTPLSALVVMFSSVFLVAFISVRYRRQTLGLASIILAGVAPLLTDSPDPTAMGLFTYLLVVVVGTLWVVYYTGWARLTWAALLLVSLYGLPYLASFTSGQDIAFLFALLFTALFFSTNMASILYQKNDGIRGIQLSVALGTVLYALVWIAAAASPEFKVLLYIAWMFVFALGSYVVFWYAKVKGPFYVYGGASIALLAAATAEVFHGSTLTIAFTMEVVAITLTSLWISSRSQRVEDAPQHPLFVYTSFLFIAPLTLSMGSIVSPQWVYGGNIFNEDLFVLLILTAGLLVTGVSIPRFIRPLTETAKTLSLAFLILGGTYVSILVWLILHSLFPSDFASMISLVIYSIVGITFYVSGKLGGQSVRKTIGSVLVGLVILRLLTIEIWQMAAAGRIITFFVIGVLLVSTAFIGNRKK